MTVLDRFRLEDINERAAAVGALDVKRLVLFLLALPFMLVGWTLRIALFMVAWAYSAALVGWESGPSAGFTARTGEDG